MSGHRIEATPDTHNNIYRIRPQNGVEVHVIAPTLYEALNRYRTSSQADEKLMTVTFLAKVDL